MIDAELLWSSVILTPVENPAPCCSSARAFKANMREKGRFIYIVKRDKQDVLGLCIHLCALYVLVCCALQLFWHHYNQDNRDNSRKDIWSSFTTYISLFLT